MTNLKKVGLSALAGSLVAVSAYAGELSVSGSAKFSYTADTGNEDAEADGNRFGMAQGLSFSGSGELDNGHTVSLTHVMSSNGGGKSTSVLSYDMGAIGSIKYQQDSGSLGIGNIDDVTPTADEEVFNGLDTEGSNETPNGRVSGGITGFQYTYSNDMLTAMLGYSPKSDSSSTADGSNGTAAALQSSTSIALKINPMDGLTIVAGTGSIGNATDASKEDDHDTYGIVYAWGPIQVGYQHSEIDDGTTSTTADTEQDMVSIAFAVNENLSISYGEQDTDRDGATLTQEVKGFSVGYSMGGMTIKAHKNEGTNIAQSANNESEHTEIAVSFAF
jgi:outer membrane protein OmpU